MSSPYGFNASDFTGRYVSPTFCYIGEQRWCVSGDSECGMSDLEHATSAKNGGTPRRNRPNYLSTWI